MASATSANTPPDSASASLAIVDKNNFIKIINDGIHAYSKIPLYQITDAIDVTKKALGKDLEAKKNVAEFLGCSVEELTPEFLQNCLEDLSRTSKIISDPKGYAKKLEAKMGLNRNHSDNFKLAVYEDPYQGFLFKGQIDGNAGKLFLTDSSALSPADILTSRALLRWSLSTSVGDITGAGILPYLEKFKSLPHNEEIDLPTHQSKRAPDPDPNKIDCEYLTLTPIQLQYFRAQALSHISEAKYPDTSEEQLLRLRRTTEEKTADGKNFVYHVGTTTTEDNIRSLTDQVISPEITARINGTLHLIPPKNIAALKKAGDDATEVYVLTDAKKVPIRIITAVLSENREDLRLFETYTNNWNKEANSYAFNTMFGIIQPNPAHIQLPVQGTTSPLLLTQQIANFIQTVPALEAQDEQKIIERARVTQTPDGQHFVYTGYMADELKGGVQNQLAIHHELFQDMARPQVFVVTDKNNHPQRVFVADVSDKEITIERTLNLNENSDQKVKTLPNPIKIARASETFGWCPMDIDNVAGAIQKIMDSGQLTQVNKPLDPVQVALEKFRAPVAAKDDSQAIVASAQLAVNRFGEPTAVLPDNKIEMPTVQGVGRNTDRGIVS